jgi:hypothetical protein
VKKYERFGGKEKEGDKGTAGEERKIKQEKERGHGHGEGRNGMPLEIGRMILASCLVRVYFFVGGGSMKGTKGEIYCVISGCGWINAIKKCYFFLSCNISSICPVV